MKEYKYKINGENYNVTINEVNDTTAQVEVNVGNPIDRGAWRATVHGVAKSWTRLSD